MRLFTPLAKLILKGRPSQAALPGIKVSGLVKKKKEAREKKDGRRAIVIIFLLTVLASGIFYLKTELPKIWQKMISPAVISTLPEKNDDPSLVLENFETLTRNLRGRYGFYVYRFDSKESYGIRTGEVFTAASLIKLPVMLTVYQEAEKGTLALDKYRGEIEAMGRRSDNAAFGRVVKFLGETKIQETIDGLGMKRTSFKDNKTTPADIGLFFQKLYQGKLISDQHQDQFFDFLTKTNWEDRIPAGIPKEIKVAHKIGTETGAFSDAGIVFAQKPFVLVIMSETANEIEAKKFISQLAKLIWNFETSQ